MPPDSFQMNGLCRICLYSQKTKKKKNT